MKRALLVLLLAAAVLAVPTASAEATMETTLCLNSTTPCGSLYPGGHTFKAAGTMIIGDGIVAPTCSSSIEFKTKTATRLPLKAETSATP